ncbi:hypothetical protein E2986_11721 [Frieseomelitta varia]|uniref:Uncharacterized protein n=1 Tax=Frieseomelitta varia TaxID=561572 RepID=A0A833S7D8_9HYME|nr:hypothetical protein E2986_11721 [Frieseomelitta varia]
MLNLILIISRSNSVIKITAGKMTHMSINTFGDVNKIEIYLVPIEHFEIVEMNRTDGETFKYESSLMKKVTIFDPPPLTYKNLTASFDDKYIGNKTHIYLNIVQKIHFQTSKVNRCMTLVFLCYEARKDRFVYFKYRLL